jgi:anti-anti-sigma factor
MYNVITIAKLISKLGGIMSITTQQVPGNEMVTVIGIEGTLDASNYRAVMQAAQDAHNTGANFLIIDLSEVNFMSSSGLVALHSMALLMRDVEAAGSEGEIIPDSGKQKRVKLLKPQSKVRDVLNTTGFIELYEIYDDLEAAINSCEF